MLAYQELKRIRDIQVAHHAEVEVPDFPRIEKVVKVLCQRPSGKLLDVGYSQGSFADYMSEHGWECIGLDLNKHKDAKIRTIECDLNLGFPVETETFDALTAGEVIEHMIDEESFLLECHRVLKKWGTLVLTTPNLAFSLNRLRVFMGSTPLFVYAPYHYHFHTRETITRLVKERGFDVEKVISSHVLYSRRKHATGLIFEWLGDLFPTFGAHLIIFAQKV